MIPVLIVIGALGIGFISAMAGIGGGSLLVPFLVLALGYDVKIAIATSLMCIVVTSSSASSEYLRRGLVDMNTALLLEPLTALGAITGAYVTLSLPANALKVALGALFLYISTETIWKALHEQRGCEKALKNVTTLHKAVGSILSFMAGLTSGIFGIGGGVIKVPIMTYIMKLPIKTAVATSSFMVGLTAASGEIVYLTKGLTDPLTATLLSIGIIPGAILGAKCLKKTKPKYVKIVFGAVLLYASLRLLISITP